MRFLVIILPCFFSLAFAMPADDDQGPPPPLGALAIDPLDGNEEWTGKLNFKDSFRAEIAREDSFLWSAIFEVSPVERWLLQVQRSDYGETAAFLCFVGHADGGMHGLPQPLSDNLTFTFLEILLKVPVEDLHQIRIDFKAWDTSDDRWFCSYGEFLETRSQRVTRELIFNSPLLPGGMFWDLKPVD